MLDADNVSIPRSVIFANPGKSRALSDTLLLSTAKPASDMPSHPTRDRYVSGIRAKLEHDASVKSYTQRSVNSRRLRSPIKLSIPRSVTYMHKSRIKDSSDCICPTTVSASSSIESDADNESCLIGKDVTKLRPWAVTVELSRPNTRSSTERKLLRRASVALCITTARLGTRGHQFGIGWNRHGLLSPSVSMMSDGSEAG